MCAKLLGFFILSASLAVHAIQTEIKSKSNVELSAEVLDLIEATRNVTLSDDAILILSISNTSSDEAPLPTVALLPYLTSHPKTSLVFHDLSTSKNVTTEVSSLWNAKSSLEHARRVKILLVFNYTLMITENKTVFSGFLDQVSRFIANVPKYRASIALIASHCKTAGHLASLHTTRRIGRVLQDLKKNSSTNRLHLIDTLLSKGIDGSFNHIGYFHHYPATLVPVVYNLKYSFRSGSDFNFSISPPAKILLEPLGNKVNLKITETCSRLGAEIQSLFEQRNYTSTSLATTVGKLLQDYQVLNSQILNLQHVKLRRNFTQAVEILNRNLKLGIDRKLLQQLQTHVAYLDFIDAFAAKRSPAISPEWFNTLKSAVDKIFTTIFKLAIELNRNVERMMQNATTEMRRAYQAKLSQFSLTSPPSDERILLDLRRDYDKLNELVIYLPSAKTFKDFRSMVASTSAKLSIRNHKLEFLNSPTFLTSADFNLTGFAENSPPFNVEAWIRPFDQLLLFIRIEKTQLEFQHRDLAQRELLLEIRQSLQEKCERELAEVRASLNSKCAKAD